MSGKKGLCLLISCCVVWLGSSCGYRFVGSGGTPQGIDKLFIDLFENRTTETGIEVLITDNLKDEFIHKYGGALAQREHAAAVLSGSISGIKTWTVSRRGVLSSLERRIQITLDVALKDAAGETIRSATDISAAETFAVVTGDREATDENKQAAIESLSKQIAEAVFHRLTEDF
jgi:hypothetical protein